MASKNNYSGSLAERIRERISQSGMDLQSIGEKHIVEVRISYSNQTPYPGRHWDGFTPYRFDIESNEGFLNHGLSDEQTDKLGQNRALAIFLDVNGKPNMSFYNGQTNVIKNRVGNISIPGGGTLDPPPHPELPLTLQLSKETSSVKINNLDKIHPGDSKDIQLSDNISTVNGGRNTVHPTISIRNMGDLRIHRITGN